MREKLERAHTIIDVQKKLCTLLGLPTAQRATREGVMAAFHDLRSRIGIAPACTALQVSRAGVYRERARRQRAAYSTVARDRPRPALALNEAERHRLLGILNSERFADVAPASVFATLLDEGRYHGSVRTMYRLLAAENQSGERRRQRVHPAYAKPELLATRSC